MGKRAWLAATLLPILALCVWQLQSTGPRGDALARRAALYDELESRHALAHGFDPLLSEVFTQAVTLLQDRSPVRVNQPHQPDAINVYVVYLSPRIGTESADLGRLQKTLRNNFLALPPDTVLVDAVFLSALLLNTYNDALSLGQAVQANDVAAARKFAGLSRYLRLDNLERYTRGTMNDVVVHGEEVVKAAMSVGPELRRVYFAGLLPIVMHELAHLRGAGHDLASNWQTADLAERILERYLRVEEQRADDEALRLTRDYLTSRQRDFEKRFETHKGEQDPGPLFELMAVVTFGSYLRDLALQDIYQDFRGIRSRDYFVDIRQRSCTETTTAISRLPLHHPDRAVSAEPYAEIHPLLTSSEFQRMRERALAPIAAIHAHNLVRAWTLLTSIPADFANTKVVVPEDLFESQVRLLDALSRNDPSVIVPPNTRGLGLNADEAFERIEPQFVRWDKAVNCDPSGCLVGFLRDDDGYIEILGPMNDIRRVRLVIKLLRWTGGRPHTPEEVERITARLFVLLQVIDLLIPEARDQVRKVLENVDRCWWFAEAGVSGNRVFRFRTLNDSGYCLLDVQAKGS